MTRPTQSGRLVNLHKISSKIGKPAAGLRAAQAATDEAGVRSAELWLYGIVGGYWYGFNAASVADQLRTIGDVDYLTVRVYSPGGDAFDGIAIGNLFRNHQAHVRIVVDSLAASAASIIALAGDEVVMSPGSQLMVHDPWLLTVGNAKELRQDADFLDKQADNMAAIYAMRTGGTPAEWRAAMTAEPDGTWYTAAEAVAAKLADRIGTVTSTSTPPAPPVDDFENDDEMAALAAWDLEVLVHPAARAAWQAGAPKPPTASAGGSTETEGGSAVAFSDEQITTMRGTLGLAETADEAAIVSAINAVVQESLEERPPADAPQIPEGMSLVDSALLEQLQAGAAAGVTASQTLANQERDRVINAALADGRIAATSRESFVQSWDENPERTRSILDALTPGLVPTQELGHGAKPEASADDELYALVFGDEQKGA